MAAAKVGALAVLLLGAGRVRAQVLDDSTKVLYGPKTTRVVYEAEVLRDSTGGTVLDTSLVRWPQARFWVHDSTFQQDLGALGTASRPLLYQPNLELGARLGRTVFDRYARDPARGPYYDSRSPYSFFRWIQSSQGEQVFEISYSRSLRRNFSVGVAYERIASNKVLGTRTQEGLVEHNNVRFFGRYQTDDERYHLLFSLNTSRHRASEQGGIRPYPGEVVRDADSVAQSVALFNYDRQRVYLSRAANAEDRNQLHLLQTYRLLRRGLTAYHVLDARQQFNSYIDEALPRDPAANNLYFYPRTLRNFSATSDRANYRQLDNTLGVLGRTDRVEYRLYGRVRNADLTSRSTPAGSSGPGVGLEDATDRRTLYQGFAGGTAAFNYRRVYAVETSGEFKFLSVDNRGTAVKALDEYWLRGVVRTGPVAVEALISSYAPTLTQQEFVGNHYEWHNIGRFDNTVATHLGGRLALPLPLLPEHRFEVGAALVNLANLVYYNQQGEPAQLADNKQLLVGFARHRVRLGKFRFDNQATYTQGGDGQGLRIPALVAESRAYYQGYLFKKALLTQAGVQVYYQSRFRGYQYSPSTQQFYLQDNFTIRNYPVADVFASFDIRSVSIFLKLAYVNQGILHDGYFTTPYYTGYPRRVQFGVKWDFFN